MCFWCLCPFHLYSTKKGWFVALGMWHHSKYGVYPAIQLNIDLMFFQYWVYSSCCLRIQFCYIYSCFSRGLIIWLVQNSPAWMKWTFQCWPWLLVPKEVMGTGVDEDLTGPVSSGDPYRWAPQWCERCWFTAWFVRPFINPTVTRAGLSPTRRRCACCFPVKRRRSRWTTRTRTRKAPMEATSEGPNWRSTSRLGPWGGGEAPKFC